MSPGGLTGHLSNGETLLADEIMFAIGRGPNTSGLGLEKAGVRCGKKGEIKVDANSRTNVSSIYAVGDVTDRVNLTPVAIREGHAFADSVFGKKAWSVDHDLIPTGVFSTPEIGTVGLAEHTAVERSRSRCLQGALPAAESTLSGREERMLMKLVVEAPARVVGCHVLGPDAAEMVQIAAIAMRMGATKADFDATMALHPTAAEELVTMREKWIFEPIAPLIRGAEASARSQPLASGPVRRIALGHKSLCC